MRAARRLTHQAIDRGPGRTAGWNRRRAARRSVHAPALERHAERARPLFRGRRTSLRFRQPCGRQHHGALASRALRCRLRRALHTRRLLADEQPRRERRDRVACCADRRPRSSGDARGRRSGDRYRGAAARRQRLSVRHVRQLLLAPRRATGHRDRQSVRLSGDRDGRHRQRARPQPAHALGTTRRERHPDRCAAESGQLGRPARRRRRTHRRHQHRDRRRRAGHLLRDRNRHRVQRRCDADARRSRAPQPPAGSQARRSRSTVASCAGWRVRRRARFWCWKC